MNPVAALLAPDEPAPVLVHRPSGGSPFLLACDHAGLLIPRRLGRLGITEAELHRHIGWDIGIWAVTRHLADTLDATAIGQAYSRLVIDCNRAPGWASAIPTVSESTEIPGNAGLDDAGRAERVAAIHAPYHDRLAAELQGRLGSGRPVVFVAMHSFTPVYKGVSRPWHAGVLFTGADRLSRAMLGLLRAEPGLVVGENEPYALAASSDHTVPRHAWARGLRYLELEIRQDLITTAQGQRDWADRLARLLPLALNATAS